MKVALTRTPEDVEKDRKTFERAGFEVVAIPLLEEVPMDFEVPELYFDFVVFQSARAVRHFLSRHRLRNEKVLVVGEKTRREVESFGYEVWAMPEKYYGEELLKLFKGLSGRVLVPRSAVGREELIEGLKSLGLEVYPLDIYAVRERTYEKEELLGKFEGVDAVVFASPSAIKGLLANLQKEETEALLKDKRVVCLGKTTKSFLEEHLRVKGLMPEKPTIEKVVELLSSMA